MQVVIKLEDNEIENELNDQIKDFVNMIKSSFALGVRSICSKADAKQIFDLVKDNTKFTYENRTLDWTCDLQALSVLEDILGEDTWAQLSHAVKSAL